MTAVPERDYGIKLGTALFTLVEPRPGHEVAYNRWYERDHFYAGCMIGPWNFAGRRWVATRPLKDLRHGAPENGSYLAVYWVLDGHHDDWNRWGVDQVNWLHANGRMFSERDHIHTALYRHEWARSRDPDGVPAELALDHPYRGLVAVIGSAAEAGGLDPWLRDTYLPNRLGESGAGLCLGFSPLPLLADAPGDVPRTETGNRFLLLFFLDEDPASAWPRLFASLPADVEATGNGRIEWTAPFIPTIPGTDTYTDQLG